MRYHFSPTHTFTSSRPILPNLFSPTDETFDLGPRFELKVEVRPRVASGLLLHVPSEHGHFSVFLRGGEVSPALFARRLAVFRFWK